MARRYRVKQDFSSGQLSEPLQRGQFRVGDMLRITGFNKGRVIFSPEGQLRDVKFGPATEYALDSNEFEALTEEVPGQH